MYELYMLVVLLCLRRQFSSKDGLHLVHVASASLFAAIQGVAWIANLLRHSAWI